MPRSTMPSMLMLGAACCAQPRQGNSAVIIFVAPKMWRSKRGKHTSVDT